MLRREAFIRFPIQGNVLECLDDGRLEIGKDTLLEPNCWLTIGEAGRLTIGERHVPQHGHAWSRSIGA